MCSWPDRGIDRGNALDACCPFFLPPRQVQTLYLAAKGETVRGIGRQLGITPRTVKKHLSRSRQTLNAINTTHAVAIALSLRLIQL